MSLCSPRGQTLRKQELRILPLSPGSWTSECCFQVQTTVSFGSNMDGVAFCCAVWICFSNWMFLALHNIPEGGELEWQWARVYHKLRRLSSQIQSALNLPHTSPPGQQREAEFLNILIQFFLRGQKVLEAHLFCGVLNFTNYNWPEILTVF